VGGKGRDHQLFGVPLCSFLPWHRDSIVHCHVLSLYTEIRTNIQHYCDLGLACPEKFAPTLNPPLMHFICKM
jgi:hypothetical protein